MDALLMNASTATSSKVLVESVTVASSTSTR